MWGIVGILAKLGKVGFSMEYFTLIFHDFLAQISKFAWCVVGWVPAIWSKHLSYDTHLKLSS